jgi:hypothetical protein
MSSMTGSHATFDRSSRAASSANGRKGGRGRQENGSGAKSGDTAAANAAGEMMTRVVSEPRGKRRTRSPEGFCPIRSGAKRTSQFERNGAMGMQVATATARYGDDNGGQSLKRNH